MEHILVQDNNGRWYVIPLENEEDFWEWCDVCEEECLCPDEDDWIEPLFAKKIHGGPCSVTFEVENV